MNAKSEKDQLAEEVVDRWVSFQLALSNGKYPTAEFTAFAASVREYVRVAGRDPLIHREVGEAINGLVDFLKVERPQVPDAIISEQVDWRVFSSLDTIRTSRATSRRVFNPRTSCVLRTRLFDS